MKLTIRHPAGVEVSFEGDLNEFNEVKLFLAEPPAMVEALRSMPPASRTSIELPPGDPDPEDIPGAGALDARSVAGRLSEVGATTDIERVTVMTQLAVDAGFEGVDYATIERLYRELGLRLPTKLRATFSNSKQRGLVRSIGQGRWKTTVAGENYARFGHRDTPRRRSGRARAQATLAPGGGEDE
jgi:hypothetical protein